MSEDSPVDPPVVFMVEADASVNPEDLSEATRKLRERVSEVEGLRVGPVNAPAPAGTRSGVEWIASSFGVVMTGAASSWLYSKATGQSITDVIAEGFPGLKKAEERLTTRLHDIIEAWLNRDPRMKVKAKYQNGTEFEVSGDDASSIAKVVQALVPPDDAANGK